jgi:hypothetical protein
MFKEPHHIRVPISQPGKGLFQNHMPGWNLFKDVFPLKINRYRMEKMLNPWAAE